MLSGGIRGINLSRYAPRKEKGEGKKVEPRKTGDRGERENTEGGRERK